MDFIIDFNKMKSYLLIYLLIFSFLVNGQGDILKKNSIGIEILGSAGLYSIVYNRTLITYKKFNFQIRPQLSVLPGETESEIPRHIVPIVGVNSQLLFNKLILNLNMAVGVDFNWGKGSYGPRIISAVSFGPKLKTDFATWGIAYTYFLKEPEYFGLNIYPHSFGVTMEVEF
jgi:hypothetical protein